MVILPRTEPEVGPDFEPEPEPEVVPDFEPEPEPEVVPDFESEPEPGPEVGPEPRVDSDNAPNIERSESDTGARSAEAMDEGSVESSSTDGSTESAEAVSSPSSPQVEFDKPARTHQLKTLKINELRKICRTYKLTGTGTKATIINRIVTYESSL